MAQDLPLLAPCGILFLDPHLTHINLCPRLDGAYPGSALTVAALFLYERLEAGLRYAGGGGWGEWGRGDVVVV